MRSLKIIPFVLSFIFSLHIAAQNAPDSMINRFFSRYQEKHNEAVYDIFSSNPWKSSDEVYSVKTKLANMVVPIGKYIDYELITKKSVGSHFILYSYMVRYDREPLRFSFLFYQTKDKWILYDLKFDDYLDKELEKAAAAEWLPENMGDRK
jgi:hypothetical protein